MLSPHEPPPFEVVRPNARSRVLLVCDHASNRVPEALGSLGVSQEMLATHIGWDIGAAAVARHLSELLDATLFLSGYSRLVIDCNRPPHVDSSIPTVSGGVAIPGNEGVGEAAREARRRTFFEPYHAAITAELDARMARGGAEAVTLLAIHSFTPELLGEQRPWPVALLYGRDARLAHAFRDRLRRDPALLVGDNQPYRVSADSDYSIPVHGEARGILHTAFEIRQDGVTEAAGQRAWAERIAATFAEIR
jgi:predicted N-formylglutamate amidohydrolase